MKNMMHSELSRRELLTLALGAGSLMLLPPSLLYAATVMGGDPRMAQILAKTIAVDMHNHVYPLGTEPRMNHAPPTRTPAHLHIADELKRAGFTAVCASFVLDFADNKKPGDAHKNFLHWLDAVDEQLEKGKIQRALTMKDLQSAHDSGKPTIIQSVEGAHFIEGQLERVEEVYKRGVRHLQLLHERDDQVKPLGDTNIGDAHLGGLTEFGASVIKECNRLGILVDLAHASHETVLGALKVATRPFIISHTSLDSRMSGDPKTVKMMKPRLMSKEHAKVVADAGGVIGVWTHLADSLKDFVGSIQSMVDAVGVDHVGIGSDTDLLSAFEGHGTNVAWPDLKGAFFPTVVGEMMRQGFSAEDIVKIGGGNFCRVFAKATNT